ncbi:MAG: hypothetical protein IPK82_28245 [Polyangiaceae bacterium]|nr:hypothetical protein [Polyangiaceae bacterium]
MNTRLGIFAASIFVAAALVSGCDGGGDGTGGTAGKGGSTGGSGGSGATGGSGGTGGSSIPAPPTLGKQIDRMGRPAINTAANNTFNDNPEQADQAKDAYNADGSVSTWASSYAGEIGKNLAILDGLDTVCGNQLLADGAKNDPTRYAGLAGALADDRLYVNTAGASCTTYLAVEADATGILANNDCGGRRLSYDVIDISYSALAAGALSGVSDDVDALPAAQSEVFPHLIAPY